MAADSQAPVITKSKAALVLTIQDTRVLVVQQSGCELVGENQKTKNSFVFPWNDLAHKSLYIGQGMFMIL